MDFKEFWGWLSGKKQVKKTPSKVAVSTTAPEITARDSTAKKKLGYGVLLFILINSILGSSLFYLPGLGVKSSGPASLIAWFIIFAIACFTMLYIGELTTLHPTSGGTYEFCKRAYGRLGSFFSGWLIWLAGNFGMALNVVAAAEYFIPETTSAAFTLRMIFVVIWVVVLNFMAYRGIDAGATMLVVFGGIALVVVTFMTLPSFIDIPALAQGKLQTPFIIGYLEPFFNHNGLGILSYLGISLLLISEAFLGFEAVTYMANEAKEPKKLHKVLLTAMIICGVIMMLYILSSLGTVRHTDYVSDARPFAVQAFNTLGESGKRFVVFGMYLVIVGAAAAWPIAGSRLIQAMAKDKLFIKQLAKLHPEHKSPSRAVIFQTVAVFIFCWLIFRGYNVGWRDPYGTIYLMYVFLSILVISLVVLTVPILRRKEADLERPYKAPFGRAGPIFIVAFFMLLLINWIAIETGLALTILQLTGSIIFVGIPFYFLVEMFYNPQAIVKVNESLSSLVILGEKLFFPISIRKKILSQMTDLKGKKILEYGCSVGTLTQRLGRLVGKDGKVYALDISKHKVEVVTKRTSGFPVQAFHHPHLDDFRLTLPEKVDGVVSVGVLSYMQKPHKILQSLAKHVKPGGEIIFLDFDKFFYFIPNVAWIENDQKLKDMFKNAGFAVEVERKNGVLWQYIVIYGYRLASPVSTGVVSPAKPVVGTAAVSKNHKTPPQKNHPRNKPTQKKPTPNLDPNCEKILQDGMP
jgi:basic amino acid/polyamine antiporter, APA family